MPGRSFAQPKAGRGKKNRDDDAVHRVFVLRENSEWPSLLHRLEQIFFSVIKVWQNLHRDVSIESRVARETLCPCRQRCAGEDV